MEHNYVTVNLCIHLVFEFVLLVLELGPGVGVLVVERLVHGVHDVLQLVNLAAVLCTDHRSLRLELANQRALLRAELLPQLLDPLTLQVYTDKRLGFCDNTVPTISDIFTCYLRMMGYVAVSFKCPYRASVDPACS